MKTIFFFSILSFTLNSFIGTDAPTFKFSDKAFEVGAIMTRRNISFLDDCHSKLKPSKTVDSLFNFLKTHPNIKVEIQGHSGKPCETCKGCAPSEKAAAAIRMYLIKKGIEQDRVFAKGYGQTMQLITEGGVKAVKVNERIVFKIIYNKI